MEALVRLAPHIPEPVKAEVLRDAPAAVWAAENYYLRPKALAVLAPYLPEQLLREALDAVRQLDSEAWMEAQVGLAPRLAELGYTEDALNAARKIWVAEWRAEALTAVVSCVSEQLKAGVLQEALATVRLVPLNFPQSGREDRVKLLARLAPYLVQLPPAILHPLWRETLHALAVRTRGDLLADLHASRPVILTLGGATAVAETTRAILEAIRWWP